MINKNAYMTPEENEFLMDVFEITLGKISEVIADAVIKTRIKLDYGTEETESDFIRNSYQIIIDTIKEVIVYNKNVDITLLLNNHNPNIKPATSVYSCTGNKIIFTIPGLGFDDPVKIMTEIIVLTIQKIMTLLSAHRPTQTKLGRELIDLFKEMEIYSAPFLKKLIQMINETSILELTEMAGIKYNLLYEYTLDPGKNAFIKYPTFQQVASQTPNMNKYINSMIAKQQSIKEKE